MASLSFCDSSRSVRSELHLRVYLFKRNCCRITTIQRENNFTVSSSVFWNFTQCRFVLSCRRFGTTYRSHLHGSSNFNCLTLHDVTDMLSRNSSKYQSALRKIQEERRSRLHRDGSVKSRKCIVTYLRGLKWKCNLLEIKTRKYTRNFVREIWLTLRLPD